MTFKLLLGFALCLVIGSVASSSPRAEPPCKVYTVTTDGVYITSQNYPQNYADNTRECWTFDTSLYYFKLEFIDFTTQKDVDVLRVYGGFNSTQKELFNYSGRIYGASYLLWDEIGYTLVFESDASENYSGFQVRAYGFDSTML